MSAKSIEVTYVGEGSYTDAQGQRRRQGARFTIDAEDFTCPITGELLLPKYLERDAGKAAKRIAELKAKPFAAAKASAGNPSKVRDTGNDPRELFAPISPYRT